MMAWALPLTLSVLVAGSQWVTNPEDLGKEFNRAQRLLGGGDFRGARQAYQRVLAVRDQRLLRASRVRVTIDEQQVGVQAAARYQLANLARRQAQLWQQEAALADSAGADSLRALVHQGLLQAATGFAALRDEPGFELAETAGYLVVECAYEAGEYATAAQAAQVLLARFPTGRYALRARYTLGWAQYELKEYAAAVAAFQVYLTQDSTSIRADRARLQTGLALEALTQREAALAAFTALTERLDPTGLTVAEQAEVELAGLREGQSRRSLVAKAWIKRGDLLADLGRSPEALAAYRQVTEEFVQEEELAEAAWIRQALLAQRTDGVEAAAAVYRYGAEQATRPAFKARLQAGLMTLLFEQGRYAEATAAHRLYLAAYAEQTEEAGVSVDEARFRLAECLRLQAETAATDSSRAQRDEAAELYGQVRNTVASSLAAEAGYWQGVTYEALGQPDSARAAYAAAAPTPGEAGCQATLSLARLSRAVSDTLYGQVLARCGDDPAARAAAALELARRQRQAGQPATARALLEQVPASQPRLFLPAQLELTQLLLQAGQTGPARERLAALLDQVTDDSLRAPLAAQLGLLDQQQGDHAQALERLQTALPRLHGEQRAAARYAIGWSLLQQGQYQQAWETWQTALATDTLTTTQRRACLRGLGVCARELGDPARVLALYEQLSRDEATRAEGLLGLGQYWLDEAAGAKAEEALRQLLTQTAIEPELAGRARLLLGRALLAQDQPQSARQVLHEGLAQVTDPEVQAEYQFELGSAALGVRAYGEAASAFAAVRRQSSRRPFQASALYYQGQSQQAAGDTTAARQTFTTLVEQYPDAPSAAEAALILGEDEYQRKAYAAALGWYERLYQQWPTSPLVPEALYGAAWCCLELGEEARMTALFLRLAQEYPQHERALQGLLHLGDYYYNEQKFAKASQLYTELVARFPQTQEALQAHQLLVSLSDVAADSLYQQGMARYDAEDYEAAIPLLQQVIDGYPGTPSEAAARCNIGMAWQQQQQFDRAIQVYEQTIEALHDRADEWRALAFARENRDWIYQKILRQEPPPLRLATP